MAVAKEKGTPMAYGSEVHTDYMKLNGIMPSVIGKVETSPNGNIILRAGKMVDSDAGGWEQTEHIVLTPMEANALAMEILDTVKAEDQVMI